MAILTPINNLPDAGEIVKRAEIVMTSLCDLAEIEIESGKIVAFHYCKARVVQAIAKSSAQHSTSTPCNHTDVFKLSYHGCSLAWCTACGKAL